MTLPAELESSVTQLRAKHTALVTAVNAYLSGTVTSSKQDLLDMAYDLHDRIAVEEKALLGQVARKGRMPSLALDFVNGKYGVGPRRIESFTSLMNILNFARSTGGGRFNEQGNYEWVAADVPRLDYDPVTKVCRGLLVEEQRTNYFLRSNGDVFGNPPDFTANAVVSPSGALDATLINGANAAANRYQRIFAPGTFADGTVLTFRWMQKKINHPGSGSFLHASGLINMSPIGNTEKKIATLNDGWEWWEEKFTVYLGSQETIFRAYFGDIAGSTVDPFAFYGLQLEKGNFGTSLIPTDGSEVTRARDILKFPSLSPWFCRGQGTFFVNAELFESAPSTTKYIIYENGNARFIYRIATDGADVKAYNGIDILTAKSQFVSPRKMAMTYDLDGFRIAADEDVSGITTNTRSFSNVSALNLFQNESALVKQIEYSPFVMTETELQELTQP